MRKGKFYAVGVGPGDAELMTLKALRVLKSCPVLAVPQSGATTPALNIVKANLDISGKKILDISVPMTRDKEMLDAAHKAAAERVTAELEAGLDVAMPNLGDVSVYASAAYLLERVRAAGYETVMIPGVPSFCDAAAHLNMSLTDMEKPLVIIPGGHEDLKSLLNIEGTKVLMKSGRRLDAALETIDALKLTDSACAVENCGMENERIIHDLRELESGAGYFTTIIVKEAD